jgi:hypothetical protein
VSRDLSDWGVGSVGHADGSDEPSMYVVMFHFIVVVNSICSILPIDGVIIWNIFASGYSVPDQPSPDSVNAKQREWTKQTLHRTAGPARLAECRFQRSGSRRRILEAFPTGVSLR